jgi:hypothetical protein
MDPSSAAPQRRLLTASQSKYRATALPAEASRKARLPLKVRDLHFVPATSVAVASALPVRLGSSMVQPATPVQVEPGISCAHLGDEASRAALRWRALLPVICGH